MIDVKNLHKYFGSLEVLKGIDCHIDKGECVCVIGPSGSGKSTFLRCLNLLETPTKGDIVIDDMHLTEKDFDVDAMRKRVGMVFQKPNPFPMSIYDNIAYGPRTHGIRSKAKLDDIVEKSLRNAAIWDELKDRLKKSALGLSGGQQQRLCIARALAVEPEVLLMDEPTSALDPIATNRIEELLLDLKNEFTILIVTHNMSQAARMSDYSMFRYLAYLIEYDETQKMFTNPSDKRTEEYLTGQFG